MNSPGSTVQIHPQMTPEWLSSHLDQTPDRLLGEFLTKLVEYGCILLEVHQLLLLLFPYWFSFLLILTTYIQSMTLYTNSKRPGTPRSTVQVSPRFPEGVRAWAQWRSLPGRSHPLQQLWVLQQSWTRRPRTSQREWGNRLPSPCDGNTVLILFLYWMVLGFEHFK